MAQRNRPSTIDKLPAEIREEIGQLRQAGHSIDDILAKLRELNVEVSRSALGRHVQSLAAVGEKLQRSRDIALSLTARFGDQPDNKLARLNMELLHDVIFSAINATEEDENGESRPVTFDPAQAKALAQAMQSLASAENIDAARQLKLKAEAKKEAAGAAERTMKDRGMSAETIDAVRRAVLGADG